MKYFASLIILSFLSFFYGYTQEIDWDFDPQIFESASGDFIFSQSDGKILVNVRRGNYINGKRQTILARFHTDGSLDTSFQYDPIFSEDEVLSRFSLRTALVQSDNKIILGYSGEKPTFRLHPDGRIDSSYYTDFGFYMVRTELTILSNQKILITGFPNNDTTFNYGIFRLNRDGGLDSTFQPLKFVTTYSPRVKPDFIKTTVQGPNQFLAWGENLVVDGVNQAIQRFDSTGSVDASFQPDIPTDFYGLDVAVGALEVLEDGTLGVLDERNRKFVMLDQNGNLLYRHDFPLRISKLVGLQNSFLLFGSSGSFQEKKVYEITYSGSPSLDSIAYSLVAPFGSVFDYFTNDSLSLFITGSFDGIGNTYKPGIAKISLASSSSQAKLDTSFNGKILALGAISSTTVQKDGKVIIAGNFDHINGKEIHHIARLLPDGSLDGTFNPKMVPYYQKINSTHVLHNEKIATGNSYDPKEETESNFVNGIAIADNNGFQITNLQFPESPPIGSIEKIDQDTQGRIYALNNPKISSFEQSYLSLYRYDSTGVLDSAFTTSISYPGDLHDFELQKNDKILLLGDRIRYSSLDSSFAIRVNPDGALDTSFHMFSSKEYIAHSALELNSGEIFIGGTVRDTIYDRRPFLLKVNSTGGILQDFYQEGLTHNYGGFSLIETLHTGEILVQGPILIDNVMPNISIFDQNGQFVDEFLPDTYTAVLSSVSSIEEGLSYFSGIFDSRILLKTKFEIPTPLQEDVPNSASNLRLFPNPIESDHFSLVLSTNEITSNFPYQVISVVTGKIVKNGILKPQKVQEVSVKGLPSGVYALRIHINSQTINQKFLIGQN